SRASSLRQARNAPNAIPNSPLSAYRIDSLRAARHRAMPTALAAEITIDHWSPFKGPSSRSPRSGLRMTNSVIGTAASTTPLTPPSCCDSCSENGGSSSGSVRRGVSVLKECLSGSPPSGAEFVDRVVDDEPPVFAPRHSAAGDEPRTRLQANDTPPTHPDQVDVTGAVEQFGLHRRRAAVHAQHHGAQAPGDHDRPARLEAVERGGLALAAAPAGGDLLAHVRREQLLRGGAQAAEPPLPAGAGAAVHRGADPGGRAIGPAYRLRGRGEGLRRTFGWGVSPAATMARLPSPPSALRCAMRAAASSAIFGGSLSGSGSLTGMARLPRSTTRLRSASSSSGAASSSVARLPWKVAWTNQRGPSTPQKRTVLVPFLPVTWARSSAPQRPSTSSTLPPWPVTWPLSSSRISSQMPSVRGAARTSSWRAEEPVVSTTWLMLPLASVWAWNPTPLGMGRRIAPRSMRRSPSSGASATSKGPSVVSRTTSSPVSASESRTAPSAGRCFLFFFRGEACEPSPGTGRRRLNTFVLLCESAVSAGGTVAVRAPLGGVQLVDLGESGSYNGLDYQLCDTVPAFDDGGPLRVEVGEVDLDLTPVPGVDGAGGVDPGDPEPVGQARSRGDEADVALGDRHGQAGGDERAPPWLERDAFGGVEVGAGVAGVGVRRERQVGVDAPDGDGHVEVHGRMPP